MIILGIDPGTARTGWAVIEADRGSLGALAYGCITTKKSDELPVRLFLLHQKLTGFIREYKPNCLAVEELFWGTNAKTVIPVAQARGIALLTAAEQGVPVVSYSPLAIKRTITGSGTADKKQVQKMVTRLLHLSRIPTPDDAADALAIALTHAYSHKLKNKLL